ncbi:uncharacterized protein N7511_003525 [Penicillium nucicola]|uniref:uncharacterized protein n=1 Tax=Penicillium nucicola TaxID=1850975 RepID=UPI0025452485|nr:uncharacterized protein N7511_003525 [Penicillium nucicola]KAJ5771474.1 hypothetical protein N7511_003525 [Penicillium nucicola]
MKFVDGPSSSAWDSRPIYDALGKWVILYLNDHKFYWAYGDGGEPTEFWRRKNIRWGIYRGLVDTWSRDYHIYEADIDFDEAESTLGSGNVWAFNWDEYNEYGTFIKDNNANFMYARGP